MKQYSNMPYQEIKPIKLSDHSTSFCFYFKIFPLLLLKGQPWDSGQSGNYLSL